jgi:predicted dehydrogenase
VVGRYFSIRVTTDYEDLLTDPNIEAIAIATPAATHYDLAMAALEAGKHILVEKPLARCSAEARQIAQAADDRGLVAMCDHTYCYTPAVGRIRSEIAQGNLGAIQYIDSVRINLGIVQKDIDVFWDLLPHDLSILDSVLGGHLSPLAVSAVGVDPVGAGKACVGYATLLLPDEAIAHTHVSWLSPVKIRSVVFGGARRHLIWDDTNPGLRIATYDRGVDVEQVESSDERRGLLVQYRTGDMHAPALAESEALQGVVTDLARCVRESGTPLADSWSGVRVLELLEAVDRSRSENGALVPVAATST